MLMERISISWEVVIERFSRDMLDVGVMVMVMVMVIERFSISICGVMEIERFSICGVMVIERFSPRPPPLLPKGRLHSLQGRLTLTYATL